MPSLTSNEVFRKDVDKITPAIRARGWTITNIGPDYIEVETPECGRMLRGESFERFK